MATLTYSSLAEFLDAEYHPAGHRLGILVAALTPPPNATVARCGAQIATALPSGVWRRVVEAAVAAIEAHGLVAARRLCQLQSRPGDAQVRGSDVVDFLAHYGHEYSVVLTDIDVPEALAAADAAGCAVHVVTGLDL